MAKQQDHLTIEITHHPGSVVMTGLPDQIWLSTYQWKHPSLVAPFYLDLSVPRDPDGDQFLSRLRNMMHDSSTIEVSTFRTDGVMSQHIIGLLMALNVEISNLFSLDSKRRLVDMTLSIQSFEFGESLTQIPGRDVSSQVA